MRVGVIRGDMPGPVSIMDLETVSQYNPPTEPQGQERRFGRPDATVVGAALAGIPAGLQGTVNVSTGATITGLNHTLKAKVLASAGFTTVTVANAVYASGATLVAAVNAAIATAGLAATARLDATGSFLVLQSNTPGVGSYIAIDSTAGGSTFNTPVGFAVGGSSFTVPTAAVATTALLPVGGPLDVSTTTLNTTIGRGATTAQRTGVADAIAPHFIDTDVAIKSFQVGMISGFRSASYNPDPNRIPAIANGAAITVVQDDGTTPFTAPLTVVTGAAHNVPNVGDITITGTNLGNSEVQATKVRVSSADGSVSYKLYQAVIQATLTGGTQGVVSGTSIVLPASLLHSLGIVGAKVQVQYTSFVSNVFTVT
jgi:hypothetical protein